MSLKNIDRSGVSIVLCCYNSKNRIVPTLQHLLKQEGIFFSWEVLLIDNNSTDGTSEIALNVWQVNNSPCELRIVQERKAGTMVARYRGILEAQFRYLLFCDDDNWFHPGYVKNAFEKIQHDTSIAAVGGMGRLEFEPGFTPAVWVVKFQKSFGAGPQGKTDGDTTYGKGCLYTAGAILDRAWLDRLYSLGFESSLKGRHGKSLVAGEDTELTYALKLIGGKLHYSSDMHFKHFMPNGRMTWAYLKRMWEAFGYSDFLISPYKIHFRQGKHKPYFIIILYQLVLLLRSYFLASAALFSHGNNNVLKLYRNLGKLKASLFHYDTFIRNRKMVEKLLAGIKIKKGEKV